VYSLPSPATATATGTAATTTATATASTTAYLGPPDFHFFFKFYCYSTFVFISLFLYFFQKWISERSDWTSLSERSVCWFSVAVDAHSTDQSENFLIGLLNRKKWKTNHVFFCVCVRVCQLIFLEPQKIHDRSDFPIFEGLTEAWTSFNLSLTQFDHFLRGETRVCTGFYPIIPPKNWWITQTSHWVRPRIHSLLNGTTYLVWPRLGARFDFATIVGPFVVVQPRWSDRDQQEAWHRQSVSFERIQPHFRAQTEKVKHWHSDFYETSNLILDHLWRYFSSSDSITSDLGPTWSNLF
jgi:hypothetical protein